MLLLLSGPREGSEHTSRVLELSAKPEIARQLTFANGSNCAPPKLG